MKKLFFLGALLMGRFGLAAVVMDCADAGFGIASIEAKSEKTYYNGKVSAYIVSNEEPAVAPAGIAITFPVDDSEEGPGYTACKAIKGLSDVAAKSWNKQVVTYDSNKGLLIKVTVDEHDEQTGTFKPLALKIRVNLKKASVVLE